MDKLKWIQTRLGEASTYAGVAAICAAAHIAIPNDLFQSIMTLGMAVSGLLAVIIKEKTHA